MYNLSFSSHVNAPAERVWEHASTLRGVNEELWPLHMSGPSGALIGPDTPLGTPLFRSVISLFRLVPIDVHEFKLANFEPGRWFHESSRSLLEARWVHVRRVEPNPEGGCTVRDELSFAPRFAKNFIKRVVHKVFERRHRVLRKKFGDTVPGPGRG